MTTPRTNSPSILCYSPRPLATYKAKGVKIDYGPATSAMLTSPEAWNLAYLSHDFETRLQHPDPNFTVLVKRTVQFRLDGSGSDIVSEGVSGLFGSLLNQPAPRVVYLLRQHPALTQLPLYVAYGEAWLEVMGQRERLCCAELPDDRLLQPEPTDLQDARDVLARIACAGN